MRRNRTSACRNPAQLPGVKLSACADIRPERAEAMGEKYGCRSYSSLEEMLEKEKLDALHICTPHYLHVPMAEAAIAKGLAVFTEKPPAISTGAVGTVFSS